MAPATFRGSGVATGGPMETVRAAAGTKPWPRHDREGQIDAAKKEERGAAARATRPLLILETR
ncbi:MAG: hypothetical protein ACREDM_12185 [Methylocella sp.]